MAKTDDFIAALKRHHDTEGDDFYDPEKHICESGHAVCVEDIALVKEAEVRHG